MIAVYHQIEAMKADCIRYLIVGCKRSGTTVLDQAISGHPEISSIGDEVRIEPLFSEGLSAFTFKHEPPEEKLRGWCSIFDAIAGINRSEETRAIGFKVAVGRPEEAHWLVGNAHKIDPQLRIIFVHRVDIAAQYGSLIRARSSGMWHSWNKKNEGEDAPVEADLSAFSRYASNCLEIHAQLRLLKSKLPFLEVSYEDEICPHLEACVAEIFRFIGVGPVSPTWITSKKVAPAPDTYIKSYDLLKAEVARLQNGGTILPWTLKMHLRFLKLRLAESGHQFSRLVGIGPITK